MTKSISRRSRTRRRSPLVEYAASVLPGLEEIAGKYDLSLAAVYAAIAYYYDHRTDIDRSIKEDVAFAEAFQRDYPSPLK